MTSTENPLEEFDIKQFEDISMEYGRLMDWFQEDFPEGVIRLEVNSDQRNKTLNYKLSVYSGREMSSNQMFFTNTMVITKELFENIRWMDEFKKGIFPKYKEEITREMNNHYMFEREKS